MASTAGAGFHSKLLELTKEALTSASRVGILFNEGNPLNYATASAPEIYAAAQALNLPADASICSCFSRHSAREPVSAEYEPVSGLCCQISEMSLQRLTLDKRSLADETAELSRQRRALVRQAVATSRVLQRASAT